MSHTGRHTDRHTDGLCFDLFAVKPLRSPGCDVIYRYSVKWRFTARWSGQVAQVCREIVGWNRAGLSAADLAGVTVGGSCGHTWGNCI
ncbi:hypothetical protein J6590_096015 [Homalodisca vitripennis]|nr:hypothetical protein J6590_041960 [Homalodisca vitripennis]KAG8274987.1 hypothetical protein J6590_096015 [Homalodisca vitripennis]